MSEHLAWAGLLSECVFFIDAHRVNIDDMVGAGVAGGIVRCDGHPQDSVWVHVRPNDEFLGCVGGMISEE